LNIQINNHFFLIFMHIFKYSFNIQCSHNVLINIQVNVQFIVINGQRRVCLCGPEILIRAKAWLPVHEI